ncbi:MAG: DUF1330 domain-containing protein [Alphaproteobacteria bacterium]|jgi:uncharacterized protein (DUF1330 family)
MPAYMFVRVKVTDPKRFAEYGKAIEKLVPKFGGKYLARGKVAAVLEGEFDTSEGTLIAEYPSVEKIKELWHSPEYAEVRKLRENAGDAHVIVIDGKV